MEWTHERWPYRISDRKELLQTDTVYSLLQTTYWAGNRSKETIIRSIEGSLCLGLYDADMYQAGYLRVVTDYATFAWVCDVIVHPDHRGQGLGKWLVQCLVEHPKLKGIQMVLGTRDAHGLYEQFGFERREMMRRLVPVEGKR
ncbi:GNAT family N-acetyltransferase [Paenibacillus allorhizosphaerae]|uniref:N-acetyltransferase domain-containing protein n=1 Tax=Paenibacillus allorhizosphaerae TaxID=2849866 RepID=A0ABN7TVB3_9BACL|nr:GNAT family N-acetyltransferase [Paenibacillus allorhizosphaerae]CAG7653556.1 hypothetical protein PAECIP111802_05519 [Paenibacillus allorhizosphaerae]